MFTPKRRAFWILLLHQRWTDHHVQNIDSCGRRAHEELKLPSTTAAQPLCVFLLVLWHPVSSIPSSSIPPSLHPSLLSLTLTPHPLLLQLLLPAVTVSYRSISWVLLLRSEVRGCEVAGHFTPPRPHRSTSSHHHHHHLPLPLGNDRPAFCCPASSSSSFVWQSDCVKVRTSGDLGWPWTHKHAHNSRPRWTWLKPPTSTQKQSDSSSARFGKMKWDCEL